MGLDAEIAAWPGRALDEREVKRLSYELLAAVGEGAFFLDPERNRHALNIPTSSYWDIPAGSIEASLMGRYYSDGYPRGHWPTLGAVIRFLRLRLPGATVYYGSDLSGPSEFTQADEDAMWTHWAHEQTRDYDKGLLVPGDFPTPLCTFCDEAMIRDGFGGPEGGYGGFYCYCGANVSTRDHGKTWTDRKNQPVVPTLARGAIAQNDPSPLLGAPTSESYEL